MYVCMYVRNFKFIKALYKYKCVCDVIYEKQRIKNL